MRISSKNTGAISRILIKVNENQKYRAKFFKDPVAVMESEGLFFNEQAKEEIYQLQEMFKDNLEELSKMPSGQDQVISKIKENVDIDIEPITIH